MFHGLRTVVVHVEDLAAAKAWYEKAVGKAPYYDTPYYVGFEIGGYELGLHPAEGRPIAKGDAVAVYWGVDDAAAAVERLLGLGATEYEKPHEVGEGIVVGAVRDPFGNVFGVIKNPHFKLPA